MRVAGAERLYLGLVVVGRGFLRFRTRDEYRGCTLKVVPNLFFSVFLFFTSYFGGDAMNIFWVLFLEFAVLVIMWIRQVYINR